jgi:isoleucyl-tRNA synthetase
MYTLASGIARLMAPILPFTAEEVWKFLPAENRPASIHMASMPEAAPEWNDAQLAQRWERILHVRGEVTKALEEARAKKEIGHPLDARVIIVAEKSLAKLLRSHGEDLRSIFIVSDVMIDEETGDPRWNESPVPKGVKVMVEQAPGTKCDRCWVYDASVGKNPDHPTACKRCVSVLKKM